MKNKNFTFHSSFIVNFNSHKRSSYVSNYFTELPIPQHSSWIMGIPPPVGLVFIALAHFMYGGKEVEKYNNEMYI